MLGGANSGKSAFAETILRQDGRNCVYVATAQPFDEEMRAKIAAHRRARSDDWTTVEAPIDIVGAMQSRDADRAVLVDCLTLWLSNQLLAGADLDTECDLLMAALADLRGPLVLVSNEVGQGIVPDNALARRFRTAQGRLNQKVAAAADLVVTVTAGLPLVLKGKLGGIPT